MRPHSISSKSVNQICFVSVTGQSEPKFLLAAAHSGYNSSVRSLLVSVAEPAGSEQSISRKFVMDPHRPDSDTEQFSDDDSTRSETHQQRLARIKSEIKAGTYDTPEKFEIALERMLGVYAD